MSEGSSPHMGIGIEEARQKWRDRSQFLPPIILPKKLEEEIRASGPGQGGFPEGHLYLCRIGDGSYFALRHRRGDEHSNRVIRYKTFNQDSMAIPYALLPFEPPRSVIGGFVFFCKFSSGCRYWIDRFMLLLPDEIKLFMEDNGDIDDRKIKEITDLISITAPSCPDRSSIDRATVQINDFLSSEAGFKGNPLTHYIEGAIQAMGQPPLFSYLFSTYYHLK